jgi:transcriptional regulator with XRE-family HTH domain
MNYYGLSASGFAEKIGVQRSSISHLLSGRNKPSLDFILKIIEVFPDVDLYWILNGFGNFPKSEKKDIQERDIKKNLTPISTPDSLKPELNESETNLDLFSEKIGLTANPNLNSVIAENLINENKNTLPQNMKFSADEERIEKIVFFYSDGSFKEYNPK